MEVHVLECELFNERLLTFLRRALQMLDVLLSCQLTCSDIVQLANSPLRTVPLLCSAAELLKKIQEAALYSL